ncbi:MAG: DUF4397 domain-containing protein [Acidobacteriaceae bacterium]
MVRILHKTKPYVTALSIAGLCCLMPGCTSITGSQSLSQVRIIDASPDAPGMDVYEGSNVIAYNLGFGTVTSYVPITPGTKTVTMDTAGSKQKLVSATALFGTSKQYTVLVSNIAADLQEQVLTDQSSAAPTGEIAVRFVDEATQIGAVDIYLVPSGAKLADTNPILTGMTFPTVGGYINVPTGSYSIVVTSAGTSTALYTGNTVAYAAGAARTFVLLDQQILNKPAVNVITATDYDSPTVVQPAAQ